MKSEKAPENPVTLTLETVDIFYLRELLYEERISAEVDFSDVENMHNNRARQVVKTTLSREHTTMTKIIDALDAALDAAGVRDDLAKKIDSMTDTLQAAGEVTAAIEDDE